MNKGSAQGGPPSRYMQSYGSQGSNWGARDNQYPPPAPSRMSNNNAPSMVPAPSNFYPQQAFYMMNQPSYSATPSGPSVGYQTVPYGNSGNQGYNQNSWSNNDWNRQQQSGGSQNNPSRNEGPSRWENSDSKWDNSSPKWETESKWGNNRSNWNDNRSNRIDNRSNRDNNRAERDNHSNRDNGGSRRDNSEPRWDNNTSKWDNSSSKWDNNDSKWENNDSKWDNRGSAWGNNAEPEEGNRQDSRWGNNDRSDWNGSRDRRLNNSGDSKWQSQNRDSNRDTYRSNQSAGSSRDQNEFYRRRDQNIDSPRTSVAYPSGNRYYERNIEPQQNRHESARKRSSAGREVVNQSLPQKKPRSMDPEVPRRPFRVLKGNKTPEERRLQIGRLWRGQFIATKARQILSDPLFQYEAPDQHKLIKAVESNIRKRLTAHLNGDYTHPLLTLQKIWNQHFGYKSSWELLRDSLLKVRGTLFSKLETGKDVREQPLFKAEKRRRAMEAMGPEPHQSGNVNEQPKFKKEKIKKGKKAKVPVAPQFGTVYGNIKLDRRFGPSVPSMGPPPASGFKNPKSVSNNPKSIPLALIPGRIPQYPQGDKKMSKQLKRAQHEMLTNDLSSPVFDCLEPAVRQAIQDEVHSMCKVIDNICEASDENDSTFCNLMKEKVPEEMERIFQINLGRRIVPILPVLIRVFATPMIKRLPLEEFLKDYNVIALKKALRTPYYIVNCNSIEDHDRLCSLKSVTVAGSTLQFKPFNMLDKKKPWSKQAKAAAANKTMYEIEKTESANVGNANAGKANAEIANAERKNAENVNTKRTNDGNANAGNTNTENNEDEYEGTGEEVNDEGLCKEVLEIYEQANIPEQIDEIDDQAYDNVEITEADYYQAYKTGKDLIENEDFTDDVDVDNITSKQVSVAQENKQVQEADEPEDAKQADDEDAKQADDEDAKQADEDDIDFDDVDADDLEDW